MQILLSVPVTIPDIIDNAVSRAMELFWDTLKELNKIFPTFEVQCESSFEFFYRSVILTFRSEFFSKHVRDGHHLYPKWAMKMMKYYVELHLELDGISEEVKEDLLRKR